MKGLSIFHKLLGLTLSVTAGLVVILTVWLTSHEVDDVTEMMTHRARGYGTVLSRQARSAVAFEDRETAREVLESLSGLPEVAAVVLYDQDGAALYRTGAPSAWLDGAAAGVTAMRQFVRGGRIAVVAPVESAEGPHGTLVIELTTDELAALRDHAIVSAIEVGGVALLIGLVLAWLIARSFARRLRAIAQVATEVTRGRFDQPEVADHEADEIGVMARAFNSMVRQIAGERERLHERVADRTAALEQQLAERARMEVELRQAQKLESVGRLAAGVAHEINTPIQFVSDSCLFLKTAVADLEALLGEYRRIAGESVAGALAAADEAADAGYLLVQMPRAVDRSLEGLARVATIVRSLKEFAHPEQKDAVWADLNHAITTTLEIARNEYKYVAEVATELGELPPVRCLVGELNQAVLNIVVNAAHAIGDVVAGTERKGEIRVRTRRDGDHVEIAIADTGGGIAPAIRDKIFDPFFTTKEVGKGTGQGLAIVRSVVVDKHHGEVTVDSEVGVGTTFTLRLPLDAAA